MMPKLSEPQFCEKNDIPALTELWHNVFGDEKNDIARFFDYGFCPEKSAKTTAEVEIASMFFGLDFSVEKNGETYRCRYLYALATAEKYRNRGFASEIIRFMLDKAKADDLDFAVLVPESESLYPFYEKFGFTRFQRGFSGEAQENLLPLEMRSHYEKYASYQKEKDFSPAIWEKEGFDYMISSVCPELPPIDALPQGESAVFGLAKPLKENLSVFDFYFGQSYC